MRILVISLAGIGDAIFATPLIHALRLRYPDAQIDALVMWPGSRDLLKGNPYLNRVFQLDMVKAGSLETLLFLLRLRRRRYDLSINTYPQSRTVYRIVSFFIGARERLSHTYDCASFLDRLLVHKRVSQDYGKHAMQNNLALLRLVDGCRVDVVPCYELFLSDVEKKNADAFIEANGLKGKTLVGFHVGSGHTKNLAARRWPLGRYIALARKILAHMNTAVLLFGGPDEQIDHDKVRQVINDPNLVTVTTDLASAAAIVSNCTLFISIDSSLMHVAAAVGVKRQIVIETPTLNPTVVPPRPDAVIVKNPAVNGRPLDFYRYNGRGIVGTRRQIATMMSSIEVDDVLKEIQDVVCHPA